MEKERLSVILKLDDWVVTEGDEIKLWLEICGIRATKNNYIFRLEYEIQEKFRDQKKKRKKQVIWDPQKAQSVLLSEKVEECDSYCIRLCAIAWEDLTGLYKVKKLLHENISFLVMPKRYEMNIMKKKTMRKKLLEQGFEYDGVRQYKEGDRISRMHWNLYAATGRLWVRKNEEEEEERVRIGLSILEIPKNRISDYLAIFYSLSFFMMQQGIVQEIYYGDKIFCLSNVDQYEELFTSIFCEKYGLSSFDKNDVYEIPLCEEGVDLEKYLYDMEL